jgi:hypothetical protein
MIAFAGMLLSAAEKAGMKVPGLDDIDESDLDKLKDRYPHFFCFCKLQLCRRMDWDEPWENAQVIAKIPEDKIRTTTVDEFRQAGVRGI